MAVGAFVASCAGTVLDEWERAFFRASQPWGFILFARNVESPDQLRRLTGELREAVGREAPVLVDQEGGRVQRLRPPHWANYPSAHALAALGADHVRAAGRLIAEDLRQVGITICCAPLLDLRLDGMSTVIGDRAYCADPAVIVAMGRAMLTGLEAGGVGGIVKHMPGHGRATVDSHHALPVVEADAETLRTSDFVPFRAFKDVSMAMTAHLVYTAFDRDNPATTSRAVIETVIRGEIGFSGLLFSDDVSMNALEGTIAERTRRLYAAGCDMALYCFGRRPELEAVAAEAPALAGAAARRAEVALAGIGAPDGVDLAELRALLAAVPVVQNGSR